MKKVCPKCGGLRTSKVFLTKGAFQASYPLRCEDCNHQWEPPASKGILIAGIVVGALVLLVGLGAANILAIAVGGIAIVGCALRLKNPKKPAAPPSATPVTTQTATSMIPHGAAGDGGAPFPKVTSGKAITSFFLVLFGLLTMGAGIGWPLFLAGIVVGIFASRDLKRQSERYTGHGWLIASRVLVILFFAGMALYVAEIVVSKRRESSGRGVTQEKSSTPNQLAAEDRWHEDIESLRDAAEKGDAQAQANLGVVYFAGSEVQKDPHKAVEWFRKAAEQGNADAQFYLGRCYAAGVGVKKDPQKAEEWYGKAAEQGDAEAQNLMGEHYFSGEGVRKDLEKAVRWFRKAAEQGLPIAQYNLANSYANGQGVELDEHMAFKWLHKAAQGGHPNAQYLVGLACSVGVHAEKDHKQAENWFRKSAEQGHARAQLALVTGYAVGPGVDNDIAGGLEWVRKAAEQGYYAAQFMLGEIYANGDYRVAKDQVTALAWMYLAKTNWENDEFTYLISGKIDPAIASLEDQLGGDGAIRAEIRANELVSDVEKSKQTPSQVDLRTPQPSRESSETFSSGSVEESEKGAAGVSGPAAFQGAQLPEFEAQAESDRSTENPKVQSLSRKVTSSSFGYSYMVPEHWRLDHGRMGHDTLVLGDGIVVGAALFSETYGDVKAVYEEMLHKAKFKNARNISPAEWVTQNAQKWLRFSFEVSEAGYNFLWVNYLTSTKRGVLRLYTRSSNPPFSRDEPIMRRIFESFRLPSSEPDRVIDGVLRNASGTGFFITADGYLATCYHVIEGANEVLVATAQGVLPARVVAVDVPSDAAILKVEAVGEPLPIADSDNVRLGTWVGTVGYPNIDVQGLEPKFAQGDIASLAGPKDDPLRFQISVPLQRGFSGAPVADKTGSAVGIASDILSVDKETASLAYAVKSNALMDLIRSSQEQIVTPASKVATLDTEDFVDKVRRATTLILVNY